MNIVNGWLFTDVSVSDRELQDMGIETNDWEPCCILVKSIIAMRPNTLKGGEQNGTIIYTAIGEDFIVNEPFRNLYEQITLLEPA